MWYLDCLSGCKQMTFREQFLTTFLHPEINILVELEHQDKMYNSQPRVSSLGAYIRLVQL